MPYETITTELRGAVAVITVTRTTGAVIPHILLKAMTLRALTTALAALSLLVCSKMFGRESAIFRSA